MKKQIWGIGFCLFLLSCGAGGGGGESASPLGSATSQQPSDFQFKPSSALYTINWAQFKEFNLPFTTVYSGPHFNNPSMAPLKHGFSHLGFANSSGQGFENTLPSQRALIWPSVAGAPGGPYVGAQPWAMHDLPWNNDVPLYQYYWDLELDWFASLFPNSAGQTIPNVDILVSDIEKAQFDDSIILALKNLSAVPGGISQLGNSAFIDLYKRSMAAQYVAPHLYARSKGFQGKLQSYAEAPIRRKVSQIPQYSWTEWTTNPNNNLLNYLLGDYNSSDPNWSQHFGPFYDSCDQISCSAYYFYPYPATKASNPNAWMTAGSYLAYLLFQVEVNRAWTDKPIIEWFCLRYHNSSTAAGQFISSNMAHASAIFPFFAGKNVGLWLWDNYSNQNAGDPSLNYSAYEYFTYGLYRISQYKDMFQEPYEVYAPTNARDLYTQSKPVWRGVIHDGKMLVAAQNPYADIDEITNLDIDYQGHSLGTIQLKGLETALVVFNLP